MCGFLAKFLGSSIVISLIMLASTVSADDSSVSPAQDASRSKSWKVEVKSASKAIGTKPITLKVEKDEDLRKLLASVSSDPGSKATLRFSLTVDIPPHRAGEPNFGIKIYVNTSERDPTPGAESAHYVGMVSPFEKEGKETFSVDLAPVLRKQMEKKKWSPKEPITISLVLGSTNPKKPIARDFEIPIDRLMLEAPKEMK